MSLFKYLGSIMQGNGGQDREIQNKPSIIIIIIVTLAEHTSDHGKQTNSSTEEKGGRSRKLLGAKAKSYRLKKLNYCRVVLCIFINIRLIW